MTDRSPEQVVADGIYADTWAEPDPNRPEWHHRFARWQANCAARLAIAALRAEGFIVRTPPSRERLVWEMQGHNSAQHSADAVLALLKDGPDVR